jgi:hypothetical protein
MYRIRHLGWALIGLNAFDTLSTVTAIRLGIAHELNPLMRALLEFHPASFITYKLCFGTLLVALLYYRTAINTGRIYAITLTLYGLVALYFLVFLQHLRIWAACLWP